MKFNLNKIIAVSLCVLALIAGYFSWPAKNIEVWTIETPTIGDPSAEIIQDEKTGLGFGLMFSNHQELSMIMENENIYEKTVDRFQNIMLSLILIGLSVGIYRKK